MRNRFLAYILSLLIVSSVIPVSAYAADSSDMATDESPFYTILIVGEDSSQISDTDPVSFSEEEITTALNGEEDGPVTIREMLSLLDAHSYYPYHNKDQPATVYDFFYEFVTRYKSRFIYYNGDTFLYPAGNSMWMSAGEWAYLMKHIDSQIKRSTVKIIVNRTENCLSYIKSHHIPDTYQRYEDMIDAFYPEFSQLVKDNQSAVEYWLNPLPSSSVSIYNTTDFSAVLHELQHETSARKSNVFQKRRVESDRWSVYYSSKPSTFYYYDVTTKEWLSAKGATLPASASLMGKSVPQDIKDSSLYKHYISGNVSSNEWGFYGMLFEFCSAEIDLRTEVISASLRYHFTELSSHTQEMCYFWEGAVLHYLACLQEKNPDAYSKIMQDQTILILLDNLFSYTREQISLSRRVDRDEEMLMMKRWAEDEVAQIQREEIANRINSESTSSASADVIEMYASEI